MKEVQVEGFSLHEFQDVVINDGDVGADVGGEWERGVKTLAH